MITLTLIALFLLFVFVVWSTQQPILGRKPSGSRLQRIQNSPNYRQGQFRNLFEKSGVAESSYLLIEICKTFFRHIPNRDPIDPIPSIKTDLKTLNPQHDVIIWFGHSSVFMQLHGKKFLIDPVMSGKATPLAWGTRAYKGTDIYRVEELPEIDYLLISHDHYDHLDYETALKLKDKVKYVVTGLGVGEHFEYWGYPKEKLIEKDWGEKIELGDGITIIT